jgi:hypothetical protein
VDCLPEIKKDCLPEIKNCLLDTNEDIPEFEDTTVWPRSLINRLCQPVSLGYQEESLIDL